MLLRNNELFEAEESQKVNIITANVISPTDNERVSILVNRAVQWVHQENIPWNMAAKRSNSTKPSFLDLEKQFVFYASYHNNPVNIFIHLLCIWNIAFSAVVLLQYVPVAFGSMPEWIQENISSDLKVNVALLTCAFYSIVYLIMEPLVGLIGRRH